jgi:hypothetical protein
MVWMANDDGIDYWLSDWLIGHANEMKWGGDNTWIVNDFVGTKVKSLNDNDVALMVKCDTPIDTDI